MRDSQAQRILGAEIDVYRQEGVYVAEANLPDVSCAVRAEGRNRQRAVELLVSRAWSVRCAWVAKQQGYRCQTCGELKPLQGHHQKFRSHGRLDTVENIAMQCAACHGRIHGERTGAL